MLKPYQRRMLAEYLQLCDRIEKLDGIIEADRHGVLDFDLSCPVYLLENQLIAMKEYKRILEDRADIEEIDLNV